MKELLLAVPSRGRPHNIERLAGTLKETCQADTTLLVGLDEDDPTREQYPVDIPAWYVVKPDLHKVTAWMNELIVPRTGDYQVVGSVGDDNVFRTPGWDIRIIEALWDTPFAFGNDQYPSREPGTLSGHVFMRSEVVQKLGYFGPPSIAHMYVDVAWMAWGTACGITYLHDVSIPHLHYSIGAPHDDTYQNSFAGTGQDLRAWHAYSRNDGAGGLNADIRKLGGTEFTDAALAEFNRKLFIPEQWS